MTFAEEMKETGKRWALEDIERHQARGIFAGCAAEMIPSARWGNTDLDEAYAREWRRITGSECKR